MTKEEAKAWIKKEFMNRYYEWLKDLQEMEPKDFGWKYGYLPGDKKHKDNLVSVKRFQKYFYPVRTADKWEKQGIPRRIIWELSAEKFLSESLGYWRTPTRYFISQARAIEIYKEAKAETL